MPNIQDIIKPGLPLMKKKYVVIFVICLILLALSEYVFLVELNSQKRMTILISTTLIALISLVTIFISYRRISKEI
jgi:hypothetical protein